MSLLSVKSRVLSFGLSLVFLVLLSADCKGTKGSTDSTLETDIFEWDGYERSYMFHLPSEQKMERQLPILFQLHGGGGTAKGTPGLTFGRFNTLADRDGFIVVYPQGIGKQWNDGRKNKASEAQKQNIDDVGFIVEIVNRLKAKYNIDSDKIFTTGMSNGGFMSTRLLCERSDVFRGGAVLTAQIGTNFEPECHPESSLGVLVMNGTDDPIVPYEGGEIKVFKWSKSRGNILSTNDYINMWKTINNCSGKGIITQLPDKFKDGTTVSKTEFNSCKEGSALQFYKIEGGGHTWPGGKQYLGEKLIGKTSKEINACDIIWDFFKALN